MAAPGECLNFLINSSGTSCLNEVSSHPFANCLVDDEKELRSDADHQLLLTLVFSEPVNLAALRVAATGEEAPARIKLFVNKPSMGFDDAESENATQEAQLELESAPQAVVRLAPAKFNTVHSLVIFVEENAGADETSVRYLEVLGARARGGAKQETRPAASGKRMKKSGAANLAEVASRLSTQGSEEGFARCLLEVTAALPVTVKQGHDLVQKACEVFLAAATDPGDKRRRTLLMLGACSCSVLCLETARGTTKMPPTVRTAMRAAVQGLMSALEGLVEPEALSPLLRGLLQNGPLHGKEEAMHLFCRIVAPIVVPQCTRGEMGDDSGDSESEASELDDDDAAADASSGSAGAMARSRAGGDATMAGDDAAPRQERLASLLRRSPCGAALTGDEGDWTDEDLCLRPEAALDEFLAGMAFNAEEAADWPVLYPGAGSHGLRFNAQFEGGNLRRVRLDPTGAAEVVLCGDTGRSFHCQWWFFEVEAAAPVSLRFRIVSYVKPGSTFAVGQRIVSCAEGCGWRRDGCDYAYVPNRYAIGSKRRHYTLAFTVSLAAGRTRLAHFYPYLFGDLLCDLRRLRPSGEWMSVEDLGPTPGGRPLLMLTITDFAATTPEGKADDRPHIVMSARVHPGEVPASFMMRGVLELLLADTEEAFDLRRRFKFVVFPMLNPDGVAAGNGRANQAGLDLNRCWEKPPPGSEVLASKRVLEELCWSSGGVLAYLDFHAHSRRHGAFTLSNPQTQALPNILAEFEDPVFDRRQCVFSYTRSKRGSARCVVWKQLGVSHSHTIEATYAAVSGVGSKLVTPADLAALGRNLVRACAQLEVPDG